jgi:hypothetical protein
VGNFGRFANIFRMKRSLAFGLWPLTLIA